MKSFQSRLGATAGILFSAMLVGCGPSATDEQRPLLDGAGIFAENCAECHTSGRAPTLEQIRALSAEERAMRIQKHPVAGNIPERLSAGDLAGVIDFLVNGTPAGEEDLTRECGACHGGGRGPAVQELRGLPRADIENQLRTHPVAGSVLARLTARDIGVLIEFLDEN